MKSMPQALSKKFSFFALGLTYGCFKQWTETQVSEYSDKCKSIPEILGKFCHNISDANIGSLYEAAESKYFGDFGCLSAITKSTNGLAQKLCPS